MSRQRQIAARVLRVPALSASTSTAAAASSLQCTCLPIRHFTTSLQRPAKIRAEKFRGGPDDPLDMFNLPEFKYDDIPMMGHHDLEDDRERLHLLRLIQFQLPEIRKQAQAYRPPPESSFVQVRTQFQLGDPFHPASRKAALTIPLKELVQYRKLSDQSVHKLKLLAGVRFDPEKNEIKISGDRFPTLNMNMKWASDTLDRLLKEAEDLSDPMSDIKLDLRHAEARHRKKGTRRASLAKVPEGWLPAGVKKLP